jgi:hypothetical protein
LYSVVMAAVSGRPPPGAHTSASGTIRPARLVVTKRVTGFIRGRP